MKKRVFLLFGLMTIASINAKVIKTSTNKIRVNYRYNNAVTFVERGIRFHVFLNGDFDFNTLSRYDYYDYNGIRGDRGVRIERDYDGRIRRVGNVFINYDLRGNVKRIGNVFIDYRFGQLSRVGNLNVYYNHWGEPYFRGSVKSRYYDNYYEDTNCEIEVDINIGDILDYDDVYFYRKDFISNYRQYRQDDNYLYYRANPNANIGKRNKIIKRRKNSNGNLYKPEQHGKSRRSR